MEQIGRWEHLWPCDPKCHIWEGPLPEGRAAGKLWLVEQANSCSEDRNSVHVVISGHVQAEIYGQVYEGVYNEVHDEVHDQAYNQSRNQKHF